MLLIQELEMKRRLETSSTKEHEVKTKATAQIILRTNTKNECSKSCKPIIDSVCSSTSVSGELSGCTKHIECYHYKMTYS